MMKVTQPVPKHFLRPQLVAEPDYYEGLRLASGMRPPENLVFFVRDSAEHLRGVFARDSVPEHHHRYVLAMCVAGAGTFMVDGAPWEVREREVFLIRPFELHAVAEVAAGPVCWPFLTFEAEGRLARALDEGPRRVRPDPFFWALAERLAQAFAEEPVTGAGDPHWMAGLLLNHFRRAPAAGAGGRPAGTRDPVLEGIRGFLAETRPAEWRIETAAAACGMSPANLRKRFREAAGMSLGQHFLRSRLLHAARLLKTTRHSLAEVAEAAGYESAFSFSRAFRAFSGQAPSRYRRGGRG